MSKDSSNQKINIDKSNVHNSQVGQAHHLNQNQLNLDTNKGIVANEYTNHEHNTNHTYNTNEYNNHEHNTSHTHNTHVISSPPIVRVEAIPVKIEPERADSKYFAMLDLLRSIDSTFSQRLALDKLESSNRAYAVTHLTQVISSLEQTNRERMELERKRIELERVNSTRLAMIAEKFLQLKKEENQLQKEKFVWQKRIAEENLKIIQYAQSMAFTAWNKRLQMESDRQYLPFQVSRDDIFNILSPEKGKLLIISSPSEISIDNQHFFTSLKAEVHHNLQNAIRRYYSNISVPSFIAYKNILKSPIEDSQAATIGKMISPLSTLIFHSQVTHQNVFLYATITFPISTKSIIENPSFLYSPPQHYSINIAPLNWVNLRKELSQSYPERETQEIDQSILDLISSMHIIIAMFFSDIYCLNLNPSHIPKLNDFLDTYEFRDLLKTWAKPFQDYLKEAYQRNQKKSNPSNSTNSLDNLLGKIIIYLLKLFAKLCKKYWVLAWKYILSEWNENSPFYIAKVRHYLSSRKEYAVISYVIILIFIFAIFNFAIFLFTMYSQQYSHTSYVYLSKEKTIEKKTKQPWSNPNKSS